MGSDNLILLPQTRRLGQLRELLSSTPAYSAYLAYVAYLDFGMPMRSSNPEENRVVQSVT
jgi:hypothetical protein